MGPKVSSAGLLLRAVNCGDVRARSSIAEHVSFLKLAPLNVFFSILSVLFLQDTLYVYCTGTIENKSNLETDLTDV